MKTTILIAAALACTAQLAAAQTAPDATTLTGSIQSLYNPIKRNLTRAAEQMPEEHYGFQPTADVRTFGQLIGHVANAQMNFCSQAMGEARGSTEDFEKRTTKAALMEALKLSFDMCDRAHAAVTQANATEVVKVFGADRPRIFPLVYNVAHNNEHYGNIVTYMRLKGLVPPSSQR